MTVTKQVPVTRRTPTGYYALSRGGSSHSDKSERAETTKAKDVVQIHGLACQTTQFVLNSKHFDMIRGEESPMSSFMPKPIKSSPACDSDTATNVVGETVMTADGETSDLAETLKAESMTPPLEVLLQRRMPPRNVIQAIIDRRRDQPDPWLDDEHD